MKKSPLAIILTVVFIDLIGFGMIIPVLPLYALRFHATEWQIGFLFAAYPSTQFVASPVLGWFSDHYGRKPVLLCSLIGSATAYILMASTGSLAIIFLARILSGVAGASVGTATAYIADITPPENRSKRNALVGAAFGTGFVFGPAIGGILSQWSVVAPFWFAAVLSTLNALWTWMVLQEPARQVARQEGSGNLRETFEQAGSWRLGIVSIIYFIALAGLTILLVIVPQVLFRRFGLNQSQISYVFVMVGLLGAATQVGGFGRLAKRFGDVTLQVAGLALMAVGMTMMPFAGSVPLFLFFLSCVVVGYSLSSPIPGAIASKCASPALQGRVLGIVDSAGCLGRVFGPVLAGFLLSSDHTRPNAQYGNSPFLASGVIVAIGSGLATTLRRSEPRVIAPSPVSADKK
jgi:MFS transporter, DHA1 family, tetracycline resistance protein